jgi:hypothetical protein
MLATAMTFLDCPHFRDKSAPPPFYGLNNTPIIGVDIMKAMPILKISPQPPSEADKCKGDGLWILGLG